MKRKRKKNRYGMDIQMLNQFVARMILLLPQSKEVLDVEIDPPYGY